MNKHAAQRYINSNGIARAQNVCRGPYLPIGIGCQVMPAAEHGGEHRVLELGEGPASDRDGALAANVELNHILGLRVRVRDKCDLARESRPAMGRFSSVDVRHEPNFSLFLSLERGF